MASAAQSGAAFLQQYYEQRPLELDNERFVTLHEGFLRELSTIDGAADHLDAAERTRYRDLCSRCHKRYLAIKEAQVNKHLLAIAREAETSTGENLTGLGRKIYDRVEDLRTLVDFRDCQSAVVVGCGAFPATLLWLRDNFPAIRYVGLDIDPGCVKMAAELVIALGFGNVQCTAFDGRNYDYSGIDFVYVANHVVPKRAVLEHIARSPSVRQVVVREPTPLGELVAEAVRPNLPPVFVADTAGSVGGMTNMSYDLLLRRV